MAWTNIPDVALEPGKPIRSVDGIALRDNPIAIAQGQPGAPRVRTAALVAPAAGNALLLRFFASDTTEFTTTEASYLSAALGTGAVDAGRHLSARVIKDGVIRCSLEHRSPGGSVAVSCRILRNGGVVNQWSTASSSYAVRTADVSVSIGDVITFQQIGTGSDPITGAASGWRNLRITSATQDIAVV